MKKNLCLFVSVALLAACSRTPGYKISGTVSNPELNGQYVYLYEYGVRNAVPFDSAQVQNGKFTMKGMVDAPELSVITFSDDVISTRDRHKYASSRMMGPADNDLFTAVFVLDNSDLTVKLDSFSRVTGTPENDSLQALADEWEMLNQQASPLAEQMKNYQNLGADDRNRLQRWYNEYVKNRVDRAKNYVDRNLHRLSGAYVFSQYAGFMDDSTQTGVLDRADSVFRSAPGISQIQMHQDRMKKVAVGRRFVDFTMENADGKTVKLSDYAGKGKYVLVDFWASWCGPCIKELPDLVKLYNRYRNKNFEIVGVSLDQNREAWLKALVQYNMKWPQLSDLKGWENEAARIYGVTSIPYTVLINPEGIIVEKGLRGEKLDRKLQELFK